MFSTFNSYRVRNKYDRSQNASPAQVIFDCGTTLPNEKVDFTLRAANKKMENAQR